MGNENKKQQQSADVYSRPPVSNNNNKGKQGTSSSQNTASTLNAQQKTAPNLRAPSSSPIPTSSSPSNSPSPSPGGAPIDNKRDITIRTPVDAPPEILADAPDPSGQVTTLDRPASRLPPPAGSSVDEFFPSKTKKARLTIEDFDLLKVVGKGSFGKVMQVKKKDNGKIYAMKVLKKAHLIARKQVAHTKTERQVLEEIDHPYIVHLRYAFQTDTKLYMVLDYFPGGELFYHLKTNGRFNEERARFYAAQITLALECLHQHTIVYRDLKPENVLLDEDGHVRLTDFGLSKDGVTSTNLTHTFCGTPEYLAPEVIQGAGYGLPVDWWSLGTLLYEMLTGMPPFYNQNLHVMYEKILRAKLHFPAYLSSSARGVLSALLERNPKNRLGTATDADEVKKHPFFASIDWDLLSKKKIRAPFIPQNTEGKMDVSNVDDEFKRETPKDTPVMASTLKSKVNFPGFTYAEDSHLSSSSQSASNSNLAGNLQTLHE